MDNFESIKITEQEHAKFRLLIESEMGIKMPPAKKLLIQSRLMKRLSALKFHNFMDYYHYLTSPEGRKEEFNYFVDLVSTHVTHFFREESHFTFLYQKILPELFSINDYSEKKLRIWSAASSSGEEIYSIAITLAEYLLHHPGKQFDFEVLGTDISESMITKARTAIYKEESISNLSDNLKKKYFLKSIDKKAESVKLIQAVRDRCQFMKLNLMDLHFPMKRKFDVIFCRNVLIYFNQEVQEAILKKLIDHLEDEGYLIVGHSETLVNFRLPVKTVIPTIYRKDHA